MHQALIHHFWSHRTHQTLINTFLKNEFRNSFFKSGLENARNTQIYTHPNPRAADSEPPTPLARVTERRGTSDEQISPAVSPPATGEHQRASRSEAHPMVALAWPENGQSTPAGVHGGTAALLPVARPLRRSRAPAQRRRSLLKSPRTQRAQEQLRQAIAVA